MAQPLNRYTARQLADLHRHATVLLNSDAMTNNEMTAVNGFRDRIDAAVDAHLAACGKCQAAEALS